jgi:hypothetical protein
MAPRHELPGYEGRPTGRPCCMNENWSSEAVAISAVLAAKWSPAPRVQVRPRSRDTTGQVGQRRRKVGRWPNKIDPGCAWLLSLWRDHGDDGVA